MNYDSDKRTAGTPSKRQRLTNNEESEDNAAIPVSKTQLSDQLTSTLSKGNTSCTGRENCRYGSTCYRRNQGHLLQYRHQLLEDSYQLMEESNDFTKFPEGIDVRDGDQDVILEQAVILKNAGFQIPSKPVAQTALQISEHLETASTSKATNAASSSSKFVDDNAKKIDPVAELFEERKRKMRSNQLVKEKAKAIQHSSRDGSNKMVPENNSGNMASKWESSCPFNIFLTKVRDIPVEKKGVLSASFADLFDPSLGAIKAVCHINFMVEANWLFEQSMQAGLEGKPTRIIYGDENPELEEGAKAFSWLKIFRAKSPFPFGHHHTKMSLVQYTDGSVRFIVYTANLVESDWDNRTQGIWISPKCPKVPEGSQSSFGESVTKFRNDIMEYLATYPVQATAAWRDVIKCTDCSNIKVYFVGSAPITSQSHLNGFQFGIKKMEKIMKSIELETDPNWQLTVQCSSIGTLGASANDWLISEFGAAMAGKDRCLKGALNLVYPSDQNVKTSFDGVLGGGCLPYSAMTHMKQRWLERHLFQWKAERSERSRAPPHIKSYSRWSPDQTKLAWFLLTSANLSKAAWGKLNKHGDRLTLMSWEAGVLFVPELICSTKHFTINDEDASSGSKNFPLYFDIPLVKYENKDHPWFFETLQLAVSE